MSIRIGEQAVAGAISKLQENLAESPLPGPMRRSATGSSSFDPKNPGPPPWPNELEPNVSHNNIITLSMLTPEEVNNPKSYRENGPKINILRSGGGIEKPATAVEQAFGINTEFFIDDFEMQSIIAPSTGAGNTNATQISFTVHEPYSMGMFIQVLRLAAKQAGYADHIEACMLITLDFIGWDENNQPLKNNYSRRMIPIKITNAEFEVTAGGSVYSVTAIPWNEAAYSDNVQKLQVDTSITGRTVSELLQSGLLSLASIINTRELTKQETQQKAIGDQYVIVFPRESQLSQTAELGAEAGSQPASSPLGEQTEQTLFSSIRGTSALLSDLTGDELEQYKALKNGVTGKIEPRSSIGEKLRDFAENPENINDIGSRTIVEDWLDLGENPIGNEGQAYDFENGIYRRNSVELTLSDDLRTFKFRQGTKIQDVIEEVLLASTYAKNLYEQLTNPPSDGLVDWFKIETESYIIPDEAALKKTGLYPKVFVYKIVPYRAHVHAFKNPTSSSPGIDEVKAQCAKQYEYIYTGKNQDILDFTIEYNYAYLTPTLADKGQSGDRTTNTDGMIHQEPDAVPATSDGGDELPAEGVVGTKDVPYLDTQKDGGNKAQSPEVNVAKQFNEILQKSNVDLMNLNITIMGDPFYISDSGLGNYNAETEEDTDTSYTGINSDGAMNYQTGEVFINLIFRTPVDYNTQTGVMEFPDQTEIVKSFSGVYKVIQVTNTIAKNEFKQTLQMLRLLGQEDSEPTTLFKDGGREQSILGNLEGGVFDTSPEQIDPSAIADLLGIPGTLQTQVQAALASARRFQPGGFDLLAEGIEGANQLLGNILDNLDLPFNIEIPADFVTAEIADQLALGTLSYEDVVTDLIAQQFPLASEDLLANLDIGSAIPIDPINTLTGFGGLS